MDCEYWKNIFVSPPPLICQQMKRLEIVFVHPNDNINFLIYPRIVSIYIVLVITNK